VAAHRIKVALGLEVHLGRLAFPGDPSPRPLDVPARYHRKPLLANPPVISIITHRTIRGRFWRRRSRASSLRNTRALEYVVQDGGSTDATGEVLSRFAVNCTTANPARTTDGPAINLGSPTRRARSWRYLNSDDLLLCRRTVRVAAYFEAHPDADVVYGHRVVIDRHGDELGRWVLPPHDDAALKWQDYIPQETLFWRRRVWEKWGGIDERFRFAMDWDLLLRFQAAGAKFHRLGRVPRRVPRSRHFKKR